VIRAAIDVSALPTFAFGKRSILWWATMAMIAIEGTVFALVIAAYIYLKWRVPNWPPSVAPPDLLWGTVTTFVVLLSIIPNELARRAAKRLDLTKTRLWVTLSVVAAMVFCVTRVFEFTALNVWWDTNAYGSVVWFLLGLHTFHFVTDTIDTGFLSVVLFSGPLDANRFVDIYENALYYYFVIASWIPIYAVIYFAPRLT
jgi:heme/copper-type cytochrome/quinol oxidase subunit 3